MQNWPAVLAVAERQHGLLTRWQLRYLGLSDALVAKRVRDEGWSRPHPGVVALPGQWSPMRGLAAALLNYSRPTHAVRRVDGFVCDKVPLARALVRAALEAGQAAWGPSATAGHQLAKPPDEHWVRLPRGANRVAAKGVRLRHGTLGADEELEWVEWVDGLPMPDVPRSIIELAGVGWNRAALRPLLVEVLVAADRQRKPALDAVAHRLESLPLAAGRMLLTEVIADLRGRLAHSRTEARARAVVAQVLAGFGLSLHPRPYPIRDHGAIVAEADLAVVDLKYDIEIDGPHHRLDAQRRMDRLRDARARRAEWFVDRHPVEFVDEEPAGFAEAVRQSVEMLVATRLPR